MSRILQIDRANGKSELINFDLIVTVHETRGGVKVQLSGSDYFVPVPLSLNAFVAFWCNDLGYQQVEES